MCELTKKLFKIVVIFLSLILPVTFGIAQTEFPLPKDTELMLPSKLGVTAQWVIPPGSDTESKVDKNIRHVCSDIDREGNPWFGFEKRLFLDAMKGLFVNIDKPFEDFAWLDSNELIVCADKKLGFLGVPKGDKNYSETSMPTLEFQPILRLPYRKFQLCPGQGKVLYLIGQNPKNKKYEIYLLQEKNGKGVVQKIFTTKKKIYDVAGDGENTYAAIGSLIVKLLPDKRGLEGIFNHPSERITELEFSSKLGLFYATTKTIGFIGESNRFEFMKSPNTKIRLRNSSLFVLLGGIYRVLRIDGINKFKNLEVGS